eukprot:175974_1
MKKKSKWIHQQKKKKHYKQHNHNKPHKQLKMTKQKASKLHSTAISKQKHAKLKPNDYFQICIEIVLLNNKYQTILLNTGHYKLLNCQLINATLKIFNINQKISYSSYCFIPCYRYVNIPNNPTKQDSIYQLRNDIFIPLFFNSAGVIVDKLDIFNEHDSINIDKTPPLIDIARSCWQKRNPLKDIMNTDFSIFEIDYRKDNKIHITLRSYVRIKEKKHINKFLKWRPFKKRIYKQLKVFDTDQHFKLEQTSAFKDGITTYFNIPLLLKWKHPMEILKSYFSNNILYNRFKNDIIEEKEEKNEYMDMDMDMDYDGYWFCTSCFCINYNQKNAIYRCADCDKIYTKRQNIYYESESLHITNDIIRLITSYANVEPSECITNRTFIQSFLEKHKELKRKYMDENDSSVLTRPNIVYHWTLEKWFESIKKMGLVVPDDGNGAIHKTDRGFYGRGIYTSPAVTYAKGYGDSDKVFVCLCLTGKKFEAEYPRDLGIDLMEGFDSHYSKDRDQMEWVFFNSNQLLLIYLINYKKVNSKFKKHLNKIIKHIVEIK